MRISACWIVKDEEKELAASIASVCDCAEELIVVDTGSSDDTVRIAREYGARVEHFKWTKDFSAARNYTLSLASGDYVIFLDGDEYFDPPLTKADADIICDHFVNTKTEALQIPRIEVDVDSKLLMGMQPFVRILKRTAISYQNKIHESPRLKNGRIPCSDTLMDYKLIHTGYSSQRIHQKIIRNIEYLEAEQQMIRDEYNMFTNKAYLMREYLAIGDYEKSFDSCRYLLKHYKVFKTACEIFSIGYLERFYNIIQLATIYRFRFSRKELYEKIFTGIKNYYPGGVEATLADLHYQLLFDYRTDRFLQELDRVEPLLKDMPATIVWEANNIQAAVYQKAAAAAWHRGDRQRALHYAEMGLRGTQNADVKTIQILLHCLEKKTTADIIAFLDGLLAFSFDGVAETLLTALRIEEYRDVYLHYLRLANVDESFYQSERSADFYPHSAACTDRRERFIAAAQYYSASMQFSEIIADHDADLALADLECALYVIRAYIMLSEYQKAYELICPYLDKGGLDHNLLEFMLVIAEKAGGILGENAGRLFETSMALLEEAIDLSDVVNTGSVWISNARKEKLCIRNMALPAFLELYEREKSRPVTQDILALHEKAAPIYEKNLLPLSAVGSYLLLSAKNYDPDKNRQHAERIFREYGNKSLANQMKTDLILPLR